MVRGGRVLCCFRASLPPQGPMQATQGHLWSSGDLAAEGPWEPRDQALSSLAKGGVEAFGTWGSTEPPLQRFQAHPATLEELPGPATAGKGSLSTCRLCPGREMGGGTMRPEEEEGLMG